MTTFERIDAAFGVVYHWVGNLVGITIALFAILISFDLFLRLFNLGNLPGMQELVAYALYFGVFLAASWVLRLAAHVRVDIVLINLPQRIAVVVERVLDVLGLILCLILFYFGVESLSLAIESGAARRQTYAVPEWVLLMFFVASFLLLTIELVFRLIRSNAPEAEPDKSGI